MMKLNRRTVFLFVLALALLLPFHNPTLTSAKEKKKQKPVEIPNHVLNISKENTYPNTTEDLEMIEPSELTKELLDDLKKTPIENPDLIKMLNETTLKPSPIAIGYRGMIFLGRWPLNYKSDETNVNWQYQKINSNELNNLGGNATQKLSYSQQEDKEIQGALTNKITNPDDVKKMMLLKAKKKTKLPLSYKAMVGKGTKKDQSYNIPVKKYGYLNAYAPAINEKGQITFGEVYIQLKGKNKQIIVKNVTKQGIGAWIPIQDYLSFSFTMK